MNETAVSGARRPCKGCLAEVNYDSRIARMVEALSAYPEQCVDEHTYEHRMSMCKSCPSLAYDNTYRIALRLFRRRARQVQR